MQKKIVGIVTSTKMEKTIVVQINTAYIHQKYSKIIEKPIKVFAHDEQQIAKLGNLVEIIKSKPISKFKYWLIKNILDSNNLI